jgi:uncharacterized membrane protein
MATGAQLEQVKSAKVSRRTFIAGCVLVVATFILAGIFGWSMICNIVAVVAVINLGLSVYYGHRAEKSAEKGESQ